jgi:methionine sulfoxide reductase heme-binding subunit
VLGTLTWYVTRASGVVAYALLSASVVFGVVMAGRMHPKRPSRPWVLDVHRMLGALALLLVGVHIGALLLDSFVSFDVVGVLVPFASTWNPAAVAAGVVAFWMLTAVEITSLLRNRIPNRVWRRVHMLSFAAFVLASAHFIAAGTDATSPIAIIGLLAVISTVVGLTLIRVVRLAAPAASTRPQPAAAPAPAPAVAWSPPAPPAPPPRRPRERGLAPTR